MTHYLFKVQHVPSSFNKLICLLLLFFGWTTTQSIPIEEQTFIGTYQGLNDDGYYVFKDSNNDLVILHDIDFDINIDLYDESYEGTSFEVSWEYSEIDDYDEEGDPSGETIKIKKIVALEATSTESGSVSAATSL